MTLFSNGDNTLELIGPSKTADQFFDVTDTMKVNPQLILEYAEN